jgi:hypothetical protein
MCVGDAFPQQEYGLPSGSLQIAMSFRIMWYIGDPVWLLPVLSIVSIPA